MKMEKIWRESMEDWEVKPFHMEESLSRLSELYQEKHRAYHNLTHIEDLLGLWEKDKGLMEDPFLVSMAIFYHDAIYKPHKKNNESESAALFMKDWHKWGTPKQAFERAEKVAHYIRCTQKHEKDDIHKDLPWFLDADLSILGAARDRYQRYTREIRREYRMYPSFLYRRGRKAVVHHFLQKPRIYFTEKFYDELEKNARENLTWELEQL